MEVGVDGVLSDANAHLIHPREDEAMAVRKKKQEEPVEEQDAKVSLYRAWCKRCGICVAFCPVQALEKDEWDYPYVARPEKCTLCHQCEKLCPDFAIGVGEAPGKPVSAERVERSPEPAAVEQHPHSPERVVPDPPVEEENDAQN